MSKDFNYVNLADMRYLMSGLYINVKRCADVLDGVLTAFNEKTGIPEQIVSWNAEGGNAVGPLSFPDRGRFIIELKQSLLSDKRELWTAALLEKKDEKEKAPVLFIRMHSPSLDIPMRLEIPLRAVIRGGPALNGTYSVYLHALVADDGTEFVYYGITKRGWNLRFAEHTKSAVAEASRRLFPRKLNELIEARAAALVGADERPKLSGIVSALPALGSAKILRWILKNISWRARALETIEEYQNAPTNPASDSLTDILTAAVPFAMKAIGDNILSYDRGELSITLQEQLISTLKKMVKRYG